jgi:hypothetical protein
MKTGVAGTVKVKNAPPADWRSLLLSSVSTYYHECDGLSSVSFSIHAGFCRVPIKRFVISFAEFQTLLQFVSTLPDAKVSRCGSKAIRGPS